MAALFRTLITALGLSTVVMLVFIGFAQAEPVVPGEEHCVINVRADDRLNMRAQPNAGAEIVARKRYGDCGIRVQECSGSWCRSEDGHSLGWLHRRYLAMVSPAMYCVANVRPGDVLNLRAYPSATSRVLTSLHRRQCDIAFLPYSVGNWQKIRVDGWQGWVNRAYLSGQ